MAIRHYVLLATDGFIELPTNAELCPASETRRKVYVFGFVGGLYKVNDHIINRDLNWTNPQNWNGFVNMKGTASIPSPMIWGDVGDRIYVTLINLGMLYRPDLPDFHTVHMHGAHVATQLDGFPETSFGVPMWMDVSKTPPNATYLFEPDHPGTYMYHCHIEAAEHVQMGMYGALIIYPSPKSLAQAGIHKDRRGGWFYKDMCLEHIPPTATHRNFAYNDINTYFDREYVMLLSDIDTRWHDSVLNDTGFNAVDFKPDFWLVNGRAFPDTLYPHPLTPPEGGDPNLTQIDYESYVHVKTNEKFLLRMINLGYQVVPWHVHGWHFSIVGKDTNLNPIIQLNTLLGIHNHRKMLHDMAFTVAIGSGETYDLIITADDKRPQYGNYIVNGQDGFPSLCSQMQALQDEDPSAIFDIPTQPVICPNPALINYLEVCEQPPYDRNDNFFPQFYPAHNHDDYKVTNNGVYPGGQLILIQTDRPAYHH